MSMLLEWTRSGACVLAVGLAPVWCQAMPWMEELKGIGDPTRPPYAVYKEPGLAKAGVMPGDGQGAQEPSKPKLKPVPLRLQGIRYDAARGHGVAMINDEVVEVGDSVSGMKVVSISAQMAVLKGAGGLRKLRLQVDREEPAALTDGDATSPPALQGAAAPNEGADKQPEPEKGTDEAAQGGRKEDQ